MSDLGDLAGQVRRVGDLAHDHAQQLQRPLSELQDLLRQAQAAAEGSWEAEEVIASIRRAIDRWEQALPAVRQAGDRAHQWASAHGALPTGQGSTVSEADPSLYVSNPPPRTNGLMLDPLLISKDSTGHYNAELSPPEQTGGPIQVIHQRKRERLAEKFNEAAEQTAELAHHVDDEIAKQHFLTTTLEPVGPVSARRQPTEAPPGDVTTMALMSVAMALAGVRSAIRRTDNQSRQKERTP